jgi:uncharacterized protein (DUF362 family)
LAVVSVVQNENVRQAVQEAISLLGGIEEFVSPGDKVAIKPNLVTAMPSDAGMTTDPRVVQAIIELCRERKPSDLTILEGSATADTMLAFEKAGYSKLASDYGIGLVDVNKSDTTSVDVPEGKGLQTVKIPNILLDSDVLINVPKLKLYRKQRWASLAVKNLVGAIPGEGWFTDKPVSKLSLEVTPHLWKPDGRWYLPHHKQWFNPADEKERLHMKLLEGIVDLATVIRPTLNVIEGMRICRDPDITHYDPTSFNLNAIVAGTDPLAIDCAVLKIGGVNPLNVPYLKLAAERGIGDSDYNQIQVVGTPIEELVEAWTEWAHQV